MTDPSAPRPAVSVVVTTYRTPAGLLGIGLDSLRAQTLEDLELLVVVDGELDTDADELVEQLAALDARVRVLRPGRVGRARALNLGLDEAAADLVAIQDADDASHPCRLEIQVGLMRAIPDLAVLGSAARFTSSLTDTGDAPLPSRAARVVPVDRGLLRSNPVVHSSMLARRRALVQVSGYDETRRAQFDYDLLLRLRDAGSAVGTCDLPLVVHRRHSGQYFEGLAPAARAWSSCRLQLDHIASLPPLERTAYRAIALGRLGYQVARGLRWHRKAARA